ncbi:MAG: hypothetical protein H6700_09890 [Myxococcales bacterium]|nr:hypothetical protein [Myxococcales bacterium]MCB9532065.1 hypothetical protein [Myxococcales bacterium]
MNLPSAPPGRLYAALLAALAATSVAAPRAVAQSAACYKGSCAGLDTDAVGSNYGETFVGTLPEALAGTSGGDVDASYLGATQFGPCVGFATVLPDHIVTIDAQQRSLVFEVQSRTDTALLIHGPDGWRCNDDTAGINPAIGGSWAPGTYRIWVASYAYGFADYTLVARAARRGETFSTPPQPPPPQPPGPGPRDPSRPPGQPPGEHHADRAPALDVGASDAAHGSIIVHPGDPDSVLEGVAGGTVDASSMVDSRGMACAGRVNRQPDHIVTLTDRFEALTFAVDSDLDTTLLIHGPHGWLCEDDTVGLDPVVSGTFPPGTYRVWVGAFAGPDAGRYRLGIRDDLAVVLPPPPLPRWGFRGTFESLDVAFDGASIDELHASCTAFTSRSDSLGWVDDITVNGARVHNSSGYWSPASLCAIVALNARADIPLPVVVQGDVEGIPFAVQQCEGADAIISRFLPAALAQTWLDDVRVNGTATHNSRGYWSPTEVVAIVNAGIVDELGALIATGTIEDVPFQFTGNSPDEIAQRCEAFVTSATDGEWIDDVTVNGQRRHNNSGWWQPADVCMIVGSLAAPR